MIATIDIAEWRAGGPAAADIAAELDNALMRAGFVLINGHGIDPTLPDGLRSAARDFFALPAVVKRRYSVPVGGRGWIPTGAEANALVEGIQTPPDLKESFSLGPQTPVGIPEVDQFWFAPNVFPSEVPTLQPLATAYCTAMRVLADELLALLARAAGLTDNPFATLASKPTWTMKINHYPPISVVGRPQPGQFRIGAHTDFGTVTILDREPGAGGLQIYSDREGWTDAPYDPAALTVNVGDLLEHWSGRRWPSGRHRVLPPQQHAPDEDLISLVFFYEANYDAHIMPLAPPAGKEAGLKPVICAEFIRERINAISVD